MCSAIAKTCLEDLAIENDKQRQELHSCYDNTLVDYEEVQQLVKPQIASLVHILYTIQESCLHNSPAHMP